MLDPIPFVMFPAHWARWPRHLPTVRPAASHFRPHSVVPLSTSKMPTERCSVESWVEVSSRPSSSSLSSVADDIITTGLRVQHIAPARRRRHSHRSLRGSMSATRPRIDAPRRDQGHGAESESDRVASSTEGSVQPSPVQHDWPSFEGRISGASSGNAYASEEDCDENDDDDCENATAIGISLTDTTSYQPPPNAFSRPPAAARHVSLQQYGSSSRPYRPRSQRRAHSSGSQHSPYNVIAPSHHVDHEAALRASLSTLLSCAAAARGLPRPNARDAQPETIQETVESHDAAQNVLQHERAQPVEFKVTTLDEEIATLDKGKRKAPLPAPHGTAQAWTKDRRSAKKPRRSVVSTRTMEDITPTLLTWVVGAGMLVLVGAISFSAGYVTGREAGHAEAAGAAGVGVVKRNLASNRGSGLGLRRSIGAAAGICV
jgi:hypothetical protein